MSDANINVAQILETALRVSFRQKTADGAMLALNNVNEELTGKRWSGNDITSLQAELARMMSDWSSATLYLSDGGLSRLHIEVTGINARGDPLFLIFLTSNSTDSAKAKWRSLGGNVQ